jgi:glycosyltransferase involved in cell wall biosynthesis
MEGLLAGLGRGSGNDPQKRRLIAGDLGKQTKFLTREVGLNMAPRERIVTTGRVDDVTLAALYAGAECLLHAALLEGFGLTPLESLAAGTPVVGYRAGAVEEVVGDAGVLVDPSDPDALGDALVAYLSDASRQRELRARARPRAAGFSWDRAAADTLAVYRRVGPPGTI